MKKKTPDPELSPHGHQAAETLHRTFQDWQRAYPTTVDHGKRDLKPLWWNFAAEVCRSTDTPPELLIYIGFAHRNDRAEDPEVPFGPTFFRSDSLMRRAVGNFHRTLQRQLNHLEALHLLAGHPSTTLPASTLDAARLLARHACTYFQTMLRVRETTFTGRGGRVADVIWDSLAYQMCGRHPFLLAHVVRRPRLRALAGVNAFLLADQMPWHAAIWDGIALDCGVNDLHALCGGDPRPHYRDGALGLRWPLMPDSEAPVDTVGGDLGEASRPLLRLHSPQSCPNTDHYLLAKLDTARRLR